MAFGGLVCRRQCRLALLVPSKPELMLHSSPHGYNGHESIAALGKGRQSCTVVVSEAIHLEAPHGLYRLMAVSGISLQPQPRIVAEALPWGPVTLHRYDCYTASTTVFRPCTEPFDYSINDF